MKLFTLTFIYCATFCWYTSEPHHSDNSIAAAQSVITVFTGRTPCGDYVRKFLEIPLQSNCEMIRWKIAFYQNEKTLAPSTFHLWYAYGMNRPNSEDFTDGGNSDQLKGVWKIVKGTKSNPDAIVYELELHKPTIFLPFVKLDDDILHLLYADKGLMIGNASYSYTLNRTEN